MEELKPKRIEDSAAETIQLVLAQHLNGYDRLFGGQLAAWIDILAGVVARRHAGKNVTTACTVSYTHLGQLRAHRVQPLHLSGSM